ncbi:hypothetical protein BD324DRAFT_628534 [Kockovaella imperatae]|uniref:Uncharacterized protein n=1 Tax=Kockovaella imperatae TaxID=4999 RepID=A0A1Y1UFS6_9TREE|nr:hypothetical protein BD324DRAFT_628534 [Kockovaella imperatae]ORX36364.1 hypothetical protein BD324DRAFT_628534 [Kockovaella imperatae]
MPSCRITNHTAQPLNICLKQVTALHFENTVQPGQTIKFRPGKVWFTLEALVDDGTKKSRYSVLKSAATIAILSVAVGAVAATAGAALLPEAAALEAIAAASVAGSYLAKGMTVTKAALVSNSGTIAKISSTMLPKAIDKLTAEIGGLSALQREVLTIISSPSISSDVRHRATSLLKQLHGAYAKDKAEKRPGGASNNPNPIMDPTSKQMPAEAAPQSVTEGTGSGISSADPATDLGPLDEKEGAALEAELDAGKLDDRVEHTPIRTGEVLRVHGVYMNVKREFDIRVGAEGKLELWDAKANKRWGEK